MDDDRGDQGVRDGATERSIRRHAEKAGLRRPRRTLRPEAMEARDGEVSLRGLRLSGWDEALVAAVLGPPDRVAPNPCHPCGPGLAFYDLARVAGASDDGRLVEAAMIAAGLRAEEAGKARRRFEREREATLEVVRGTPLEVPTPSREALAAEVEARLATRREPVPRERVEAAILRHGTRGYERTLTAIRNRPGRLEAYLLLRSRVAEAIAASHPRLAAHLATERPRLRWGDVARLPRVREWLEGLEETSESHHEEGARSIDRASSNEGVADEGRGSGGADGASGGGGGGGRDRGDDGVGDREPRAAAGQGLHAIGQGLLSRRAS